MTDAKDDILMNKAREFGRIDEKGQVFVKLGSEEIQVGGYDPAEIDEKMTLYVRRYVDQINEMHLFERRLGSVADITKASIESNIRRFEEFGKKFNAVGDYIALQQYVNRLTEQAEKRVGTLSKEREEQETKVIASLTAVAAKMEEIRNGLNERTQWSNTAMQVNKLMDDWQEARGQLKGMSNAIVEPIWKRFSDARTEFNAQKKKAITEIKSRNKLAKEQKDALIAKAEEIKESEDWKNTKNTFINLMKDWKKVPRGDRKVEDKQWDIFKAASDYFFNRIPEAEKDVVNEGAKGGGGRDQKTPNTWTKAKVERVSTKVASDDKLDALAALKAKLEKGK